MAYHVTYWNASGWKDPFSFDAATARQRDYARCLGARGLGDGQIYTPEMVVTGMRGFVGSDRAEGLAAISQAAQAPGAPVALSLSRDGDSLIITVG